MKINVILPQNLEMDNNTPLQEITAYIAEKGIYSNKLLLVLNRFVGIVDYAEALSNKEKFMSMRGSGVKTYKEYVEALKDYYAENYTVSFVPKKKEEIKEIEQIAQMDLPKPKEKKPRKKGSGGYRAGAGKKPINSERKTQQNFNLRSDVIRTLKTIKNYNQFAETAILEKLQRENIELVK